MIPIFIVAVAGAAIGAIVKVSHDEEITYREEIRKGVRSSKGDVEKARSEQLKGISNTKFINK